MHIHANNNLLLASIGTGREALREVQARRASEVRKKLASGLIDGPDSDSEDLLGPAPRVARRDYESEAQSADHDSSAHRFSAKA